MAGYIENTVSDFFSKLEKIHLDLGNFSDDINARRENVFKKLKAFEVDTKKLGRKYKPKGGSTSLNPVDEVLQETIESFQENIAEWRMQIEKNKKGTEFMHTHEKYLVVMVFGAVKAGKSTLGNFFAGKELSKTSYDNAYKHCGHPVFETEEGGRNEGGITKDDKGEEWFCEGVTDTTGAMQYFTLSGLRWMDSPGTGALARLGDKRNMEEMVNEYIPYTDMCIFLMNSSEPGLQADMKYISKLSREGQEAIVVITKSDVNDEDFDDEGNLVDCWRAKTPENRKQQEDDICARIAETYPDILSEKFRAISVSTLLGKMAVKNKDDALYKCSNLDLLMRILGDKVSDEAITLKEQKPIKNVNNFIESILNGGEGFKGITQLDKELEKILKPIADYKKTIKNNISSVTKEVCRSVKTEINKKAYEWSDDVDCKGNTLSGEELKKRIVAIATPILNRVINKRIGRIIDNYQGQAIAPLETTFRVGEIAKQSKKVEYKYIEYVVENRDAEGMWEKFKSFFGATYSRTRRINKVEKNTIDLGTNIEDFLEDLMPEIENVVTKQVEIELTKLQKFYFEPQELFVVETRKLLKILSRDLTNYKINR